MQQKKKNILLLAILAALVITSIVISYIDQTDSISYDQRQFTLEENTVITTVKLNGKTISNQLEYQENQWLVNDRHLLDDGMRDVFFAVLSQVEILRPVSESLNDSLAELMSKDAVAVEILNSGVPVLRYFVYGDDDKQKSYFRSMDENEVYEMFIPGYRSYVAGIYQVDEKDWRSRFVWDVNWTSMKTLTIDYLSQDLEDLRFVYNNDFVSVEGLNAVDTSMMLSYLENIAYLQATDFLADEDVEIQDQSNPDLVFTLVEIGDKHSEIKLYRKQADGWIGNINNEEFVLFDDRVVQPLLKHPNDFLPQ